MKKKIVSILTIIVCIIFCKAYTEVTDYPDALNIKNIPTRWEDRDCFCFSDMGAWHGFGLPPSNSTQYYGGFIGPYEMIWNGWMGESYVQVVLTDADANQEIDLSAVQPDEITLYPGLLKQKFTTQGITLELEMWYVSGRSSVVRAKITNNASETKQFKVEWKGKLFTVSQYTYEALDDGIRHEIDDFWYKVKVEEGNFTSATGDQHSYRTHTDKVYSIEAGKSISSAVAVSTLFEQGEFETEKTFLNTQVFSDIDKSYDDNVAKWNGYLDRSLKNKQGQFIVEEDLRSVAVKCLLTLTTNWRSAAGDFLHDGIYPSYSISYFNGFWAWDTWKHSFALAPVIPELAKDGIRSMFDYQDSYGMVPDCIYYWKNENNFRNTKPPLTTWAVWEIYEYNNDNDFIQEMYPKLKTYHEWWYTYRDNDNNGLCEYGSTDGTLAAAAWESGMDNAVRFDNTQMLDNGNGGWSMNQESVDLNAYLYEEKVFLSKIAEVLGLSDDVTKFQTEAEALKQQIQSSFYDATNGFFYDKKISSSDFIDGEGPEGWTPLFTGVATQEQADKVKEMMLNENKFNTHAPFPTCAKDVPGFDATGYWRGPIWLDQAYFGVKALERYDFTDEAKMLKDKLFNTLENVKDSNKPLRENYNPLDGSGLYVDNFSWSAAHVLLLCRDEDTTTAINSSNAIKPQGFDFISHINPASQKLTVKLSQVYENELSLQMCNLKGQIIFKENIKPGIQEVKNIDISDVSKGIYLIGVRGSDIRKYRKLIITKK